MVILTVQKGYSLLQLIIWLLITSMILPILTSVLILTANYYSQSAYFLLELSELAFLKRVIQSDLLLGSLQKIEDTVLIAHQSQVISYKLSNSRFRRTHTNTRYLTRFLHIKSVDIVNTHCILLLFLNPKLKPLSLCSPNLLSND
tara:strand:+ start:11113 stop:11547 length:435 start_codon:yes stop_codon:yes gene_type:complete